MSWNKNTVNLSYINAVVNTLIDLKVSHTLTKIGEVLGYGLNDASDQKYSLRRLVYADKVVLEQMRRTSDCDSDDYIMSETFLQKLEPTDWSLEVLLDEDEEECVY